MQQIPPETCPWSLSGPQFPQPTAIQQRYCYPKGRPEYSNRKGGALWTMFGADGKEDKEFRLLHVYYSAKRATNKALSSSMTPSEVGSPDREATSPSMRSPPRKRAVTHHYNNSQSTSPSTSNLVSHPMRQVPQLTERVFAHSPAITSSSTNSCSVPSSPLTPEISLPLSQVYTMPTSNGRGTTTLNNRNISARTFPVWPEQMIVTPINDIQVSNVKFPQSPPGEIKEQRLYRTYSDESSQLPTGFQSPSPFRRPIASSPPTSRTINVQRSPLFRTGEYYTGATASLLGGNIDSYQLDSFDRLDDTSVSTGGRSDPFTKEILDLPLQFDSESFWNEPFLAISQTPSLDPSIIVDDIFGTKQRERQDNLSSHLRAYQQHIRDEVLAAPEAEQPQLVSLMASWARTVAEDPLSIRAPPLLKRFPSPLPRALSPPTRFDPPYNSSKDGHETDRVVDDVSVDHIVVASV